MVPRPQFPGWPWVSLLLAGRSRSGAPGRSTEPPGRGSATAPRPWTPWSAWRSCCRLAGRCTRCCSATRHDRDVDAVRLHLVLTTPAPLYFDVAAGVPAAVLTGRYLESRVRHRSGAALTALARMAAKTGGAGDGTDSVPMPTWPPTTSSSSGPASTSPPTASSPRAARRWTLPCSPARPSGRGWPR